MKNITITLLAVLFTVSCASSPRSIKGAINLGMTEEQVLTAVGKPDGIGIRDKGNTWRYKGGRPLMLLENRVLNHFTLGLSSSLDKMTSGGNLSIMFDPSGKVVGWY